MRSDMSKVIVERPRRGAKRRDKDKGRLVQKLEGDLENSPAYESMKFRHRNKRKYLNENLSPLGRFIRGSVGRPWDDVYSEICANINVTSTVQEHVRGHVYDFVAQHVVMVNGKPFGHRRYSGFGPIWQDCYVHPSTGILYLTPVRPRYRYRGPQPDFEQVRIDDLHKYVKIKGLWFLVTFAPLPEKLPEIGMPPWDIVLRKWTVKAVGGRNFVFQWGAPIYAIAKRQANKKEIRQDILPHFSA